jgi:plasmid stability protein
MKSTGADTSGVKAMLRFRAGEDLHGRLKDSAKAHHRSLNAEMLARLEASFVLEEKDETLRLLREIKATLPKPPLVADLDHWRPGGLLHFIPMASYDSEYLHGTRS